MEPLGGIDDGDDPYADYEPDEDDLERLAWEPDLTEAQYAAIGRVALAAHRVEEVRRMLARMLGKAKGKGWSIKDVTSFLVSRDGDVPGLGAWAERTTELIHRRHSLVHASLGVDVDWEWSDGEALPQPFLALRHGVTGLQTPADAERWNALAAELLIEAAKGESAAFWDVVAEIQRRELGRARPKPLRRFDPPST